MPINAIPRNRRLYRLRTILLVVMLSVLVLPIASVFLFRFYENELVHRTEEQLISQAAVMASTYRALIGQSSVTPMPRTTTSYGRTVSTPYYTPIDPTLDLANVDVLPRREDARAAQIASSPKARQAGQRMQNILVEAQRVTLAGMRLLDENGVVIAGRGEVGQSLKHVQEVSTALKGHYKAVIRERVSDEPLPPLASISRGTSIRVFIAYPIIDEKKVYGVVYLSRTPQNILKHMYQIRGRLIFLGLILVLVAGSLVLFISARLSRPIRDLIKQTQKVTKGEQQMVEPLHQPGTYELAQLSRSFAEMSEALHERSTYIDRFASHVSHEFKTPLTAMQGALELLQEHADDMPAEQRQRFLTNLYEDTQRLRRLVNRLLEQARADALQPANERTDLYPILRMLKSRYEERGLLVHYTFNEEDKADTLWLNIAPVALETVLSNLFENSLQHGANRVTLSISQLETDTVINVQDNGRGISKANQENIFTPFFTTKRDNGGTGLGLGIVQALLQTWKGSISYKPSEQGACFELLISCSNN
ncbi:sensor histidine kinase [Leucothrix arctica]|uniref:histidine kinase n=1 Tax=Leucothrix arctica TaxID=1481894 RepID=A0A317CF97_9GAMM|nr:HAMP domain-containing sensor histidine kinase [Leucothrix arctica]PWQ97315.1 sensor histidine kinase [Leucothrix arctica]